MNKDELKEALFELFEGREVVDSMVHGAHHAWIQERIEAEKARKEMFRAIARSAASWSVLVLLGYFSGAIQEFFSRLYNGH